MFGFFFSCRELYKWAESGSGWLSFISPDVVLTNGRTFVIHGKGKSCNLSTLERSLCYYDSRRGVSKGRHKVTQIIGGTMHQLVNCLCSCKALNSKGRVCILALFRPRFCTVSHATGRASGAKCLPSLDLLTFSDSVFIVIFPFFCASVKPSRSGNYYNIQSHNYNHYKTQIHLHPSKRLTFWCNSVSPKLQIKTCSSDSSQLYWCISLPAWVTAYVSDALLHSAPGTVCAVREFKVRSLWRPEKKNEWHLNECLGRHDIGDWLFQCSFHPIHTPTWSKCRWIDAG